MTACVVHGDVHEGQFLVKGSNGVMYPQSVCIADFGTARLVDGVATAASGVLRSRTPLPLFSDHFLSADEGEALCASGRILVSKCGMFGAPRLTSCIDDWWGVFFTLHKLADSEHTLPWEHYNNDQFSLLNVAKSRAVFGIDFCNTRAHVKAALDAAPSSWRHRRTLPSTLRPFFDKFFWELVNAELSSGIFTMTEALRVCAAAADIKIN